MFHTGSDGDEVAVVASGRRFAIEIASPARDAPVASYRQRVIITCGDRDEVTVDAVGRRSAVEVVSPTSDAPVASYRQGVTTTSGNHTAKSLTLFGHSAFVLPLEEDTDSGFCAFVHLYVMRDLTEWTGFTSQIGVEKRMSEDEQVPKRFDGKKQNPNP